MANETYGFDQSGTRRIVRSVKKSEQTGPQLPVRRKNGTSTPTARFWVKLTEETTDSLGGLYKWTLAEIDDKDFSVTGSPADSGADFTAIEANRTTGLTGRYAQVEFRGYDNDGKPRYLFSGAVVLTPINARITASVQDDSNKRWVYTVQEVEKTSAGYGGWTTKSGGYSGPAYNRVEDMNTDTGLFGNGVNSTNLPTGFDIQPAPAGVIVQLEFIGNVYVEGDEEPVDEYWFSYENGVDGTCPEPA